MKMDVEAKVVAQFGAENLSVFELLCEWETRRNWLRTQAHRYAGTEESRLAEARLDELNDAIGELCSSFPDVARAFREWVNA